MRNGVERRTDDVYFDNFEHWARIKNKLIVYVENEQHKKRVEEIREKFGLAEQTTVIVTEKCEDIDSELYASVEKAANNDVQIDFHVQSKNPDAWNAKYNYIMILKGWFVQDAIERGLTGATAVWMDFGFGHVTRTYQCAEEFDFHWYYDFPEGINLFYLKQPDERPIFDIVRTGDVYFMGFMVGGKKEYWTEFWKLMRQCMLELNAVGLMDDDQTIMSMAYQKRPELFHIEQSGWFTTLKEHGGEHLTLVPGKAEKEKYALLRRIVRGIREKRVCRGYLKRQYKYFNSYEKWR